MNKLPTMPGTLRPVAAAVFACLASSAFSQTSDSTLPALTVEGIRSVADQNQLPVTTGINASARTLIYADGILLSTLVSNNNQNGSPQWFMVAPEEIERIDVMYGPFSAMYPGNSYGAVTEITMRTPKQFEASVKVSGASQNFSQYGTSDRYPASQVNVNIGNRSGDLSWWFSANHLSTETADSISSVRTTQVAMPGTAPVGMLSSPNQCGRPGGAASGSGEIISRNSDAPKRSRRLCVLARRPVPQ